MLHLLIIDMSCDFLSYCWDFHWLSDKGFLNDPALRKVVIVRTRWRDTDSNFCNSTTQTCCRRRAALCPHCSFVPILELTLVSAEGIDLWGREDVPEVDSVSEVDHELGSSLTIGPALTVLSRSFFGKPVSKKVEGGEKSGGVENGAKTKKDTAAASGWVAVTHSFTVSCYILLFKILYELKASMEVQCVFWPQGVSNWVCEFTMLPICW